MGELKETWAVAAANAANHTRDFWIEVMRELIASKQSK